MIGLCCDYLSVCYYYVTYAYQSESTLYICPNVNELISKSNRDICILSDTNGILMNNHLVYKQRINRLAWLVKRLSFVVSTCLERAFYCILLSSQVLVYTVNLHSIIV